MFIVTALIIATITLIELATDLYIPCLPSITHAFQTCESQTSLIISVYIFGLGISGLFYGPFSDQAGRRKIFLLGILGFSISAIISMLDVSLPTIILLRFLQGLGGGVAWTVGVAIIKDIYPYERARKILALVNMIMALAPGFAPMLGGYITHFWGWEMNFHLTGIISVILAIFLVKMLKETLKKPLKKKVKFSELTSSYVPLFKSSSFLSLCAIQALVISKLWLIGTYFPYFFIDWLKMPVQDYGYYIAVSASFFIIGSMVNNTLIKMLTLNGALKLGLYLSSFGIALLFAALHYFPKDAIMIQASILPTSFGSAIVFLNCVNKALETHPHAAASGMALISSSQLAVASLATYIVGQLYNNTLDSALYTMIFLSIGALMIFHFEKNTDKK